MNTATTLTLESIEVFRQYISDRGRGPATMKAYSADLRELLRWWAKVQGSTIESVSLTLEEFGRAALDFLRETRSECSAATTQRRVTTFRAWARSHGETNFLSDYKVPQRTRPIPHPLPEGVDGVELLCDHARSQDEVALFALMGFAGLRISEARAVRPSDFDVHESILKVKGKGEKVRYVPLSERAWARLQDCYEARAQADLPLVMMADRTARLAVTRAGEAAGLERPISSHDLRATLATAALENTKDIRAVQEILGHAQVDTTQIYTLASVKSMRAAIDI